jgi:hypothetical protein
MYSRARLAALGPLLCTLAARQVQADPSAGVDTQLHRPALHGGPGLVLESAAPVPRHRLTARFSTAVAFHSLRLAVPGIGDGGSEAVLDRLTTVNIGLAFAPLARLSIGLDAGLYRADTGAGYGAPGRHGEPESTPGTGLQSLRPVGNLEQARFLAADRSGPQDLRIGAKLRLGGAGPLHAAALLTLSLPFGNERVFAGDRGPVLEPALVLHHLTARRWSLAAHLGARLRQRTVLEAYDSGAGEMPGDAQAVLDIGPEANAGGGIWFRPAAGWLLVGEAMLLVPLPAATALGSCHLADGRRCAERRGEPSRDLAAVVLTGARYQLAADTALLAWAASSPGSARGHIAQLLVGVELRPATPGRSPAARR